MVLVQPILLLTTGSYQLVWLIVGKLMKEILIAIATIFLGGAVAVGAVVLDTPEEATLATIEAESIDDYEGVKPAEKFVVVNNKTIKNDFKKHIRESLLAGKIPNYPGDVIDTTLFAIAYMEVAKELGVNTDRLIVDGGNVAQEIREKAKERGLVVTELQRR